MGNLYATLTDLKAYGMLNISATTADSVFMDVLEEGSREFDKDTDRHFYIYEGSYFQDFGASVRVILDWDVQTISTCLLDTAGDNSYGTTMLTDINTTVTTPPDAFAYPVNTYPKTRLEINPWGSIGHFAAGIRKAIKITGTFGYGADWPADYVTNLTTVATGILASDLALVAASSSLIEPGMTLRLGSTAGSEQVYVSGVVATTSTATIERGMNGTTPASSGAGATIQVYRYPKAVSHAVLIYAMRAFKRRESAYANVIENPATGTIQVWKGKDPDYQAAVVHYRKVRRGYYL